jgi:hypothetical protein
MREERAATMRETRPSTGNLLRTLINEVSDLMRQEIALAKAEMNEKIAQLKAGVGSLAVGGVVAFAGLIVLLMAGVYGLALVLPLWASALIVGGGVTLLGLILLAVGSSKLKRTNLAPERTTASVRRDVESVREAAR